MLIRRDSHSGLGGGWIFLIVVILLVALAFAGWVVYSRLRARRLGLPPPPLNPFNSSSSSRSTAPTYPAPAPGGIVGWFNDKVRAFKNRRYATGAYEEPYAAGGRGRGRAGAAAAHGPLDPDEAWDSRVDNEADVYGPGGYYEEQELGLHAPNTAYGGGGYGAPSSGAALAPERGRSRTRDLDERYDEEMGHGAARNPFGDDAASSLRGVSPRPVEQQQQQQRGHQSKASVGSNESSPTERRSMFRENM